MKDVEVKVLDEIKSVKDLSRRLYIDGDGIMRVTSSGVPPIFRDLKDREVVVLTVEAFEELLESHRILKNYGA